MADHFEDRLSALPAITLAGLDARAALLRRVDVKRVIDVGSLPDVIASLGDDHEALEIDEQRVFAY